MFSSRPDLSDLNARLRRIEQLVEAIAVRLEISPDEIAAAGRAPGGAPGPAQVPAEVVALAAAGKKIPAIKLLRELEHLDLATAKRIVDSLGY